jgi:hypothetical protein
MIDELFRRGLYEIKTTLSCLIALYLDRVRWVEFSASVGGAAAMAAQFMIYIGTPQAAKPAAIATGIWTAIIYLRNPKMAQWRDELLLPALPAKTTKDDTHQCP